MKTRYRKSHLIDATYFTQDEKYKLSSSYSTNSHGKQIVSAAIKDKFDGRINFNSYREAQAMRDLLTKMLQETKGRWLKKKPSETP